MLRRRYYNSLIWILENEIDELYLGFTFSAEQEQFGDTKVVELKPGGKDVRS